MNALPYEEPPLGTLLPLGSFFIALHLVAWPLDRYFSCGLLGQIFVGIVWGSPLAGWLSVDLQEAIVDFGYIGLILLVYEGGLGIDLFLLRQTLLLSIVVALTGIVVPIALSFLLLPIYAPLVSQLAAFAAGASLCSTSLGTTFAILSSAKLTSTRVGVVLVTAAMLDDVVGLVMVKIISDIGASLDNSVSAATIIRPIGVSIAALVVIVLGALILKRLRVEKINLRIEGAGFLVTGLAILGLSAAAGYAGTSILFMIYLAGAGASFIFEKKGDDDSGKEGPAFECYKRYYGPIVNGLLLPCFFASIGFAIPLKHMFEGPVVWRGIVYAILMAWAKSATGLWLPIFAISSTKIKGSMKSLGRSSQQSNESATPEKDQTSALPTIQPSSLRTVQSRSQTEDSLVVPKSESRRPTDTTLRTLLSKQEEKPSASPNPSPVDEPVEGFPRSSNGNLYPALLMAFVMTTRGEIGFLIAAIAQSTGILMPEEVYLVVMWAIVLCTLVGPIGMGFIVRKIQRVKEETGGTQILGMWGATTFEARNGLE